MNAVPIFPGTAILLFGFIAVVILGVLLVGRRTRSTGLALSMVVAVGLLALVVLTTHRRVRNTEPAVAVIGHTNGAPPALWSEGMDHRFQADIYPSQELAARALGRTVGKWMLANRSDDTHIVVRRSSPNDAPLLSAHVCSGILDRAPDLTVETLSLPSEQVAQVDENGRLEFVIGETRQREPEPGESRAMGERIQGELTVTWKAPPKGMSLMKVSFTAVPWLTNTAAYLNRQGHQHRAVVYSMESGSTAAEARSQAIQQAQQAVQARLHSGGQGRLRVTSKDLEDHNIVIDTFAQSLEGTAGKIWRQALLLDVSPEKTTALREAKRVTQVAVQKTWFSLFISGAGLGLIILILYIFLNAATRGYYTWALRIVAVVVTGAIIAVIFLLKRPM